MPRLAIYLLGPPRVELDGEALHIPRRKALALLAYLVMERQAHRRDSLAAFLWPEYDQSGARGRLRRTLSSLNRSLGEGYLDADRETVVLRQAQDRLFRKAQPEPELWLDVDAFRQHIAACGSHGHPPNTGCTECQAWLEEAVALYRDDFLAGFSLPDSLAFDEWARYYAERLRDQSATVLEQLAAILAAQGQFEDSIAHAKRWLANYPLREAAHRSLMRLYALSDQEPAALRQFQECQRTLKEELGVPPSPQTVDLMERIRAGEDLALVAEPKSAVPHNLPPEPTRFVGRETELKELHNLIADPDVRLITIVGPGGIGKTRLALAVAEGQLLGAEPTFPDGVYFVPLARMSGSDEMAPVVAEALDFRLGGPGESRTGRQQVLDFLREKRMLLLLDNFEHLLGSPPSVPPAGGETAAFPPRGGDARRAGGESGGVSFVTDLLHTAPRTQLLITSRERLPLREEQAFPIAGLDYADGETAPADSSSARLFVQCARRASPAFELAPVEGSTVARICRLLEGMPLAIELAAAWVDVLPLADIASEIQRGLDFLATEWQDAPERHRSVRAAIDASWRRLTERERIVFAQLCVFRGGFTREAAGEVARADLRTLARLADKSLLSFSREKERYDVHELLRQYGCEKLADDRELEHAARDRHSVYFCSALGRLGDAWNRGKRLDARVDFEADWANLVAAWEWAADGSDAARLDLALDGLLFLAWEGLRPDVDQLYLRAVDGLDSTAQSHANGKRVLAKALLLIQECRIVADAYLPLSTSSLERSISLLADPALSATDTRAERAWLHVLQAHHCIPDWEMMRSHYQRALELLRDLGYNAQVASQAVNIGWTYAHQGNYDQARRHGEEAHRSYVSSGNQLGELRSLLHLGRMAAITWNILEAERYSSQVTRRAYEQNRPAYQALGLLDSGTSSMLLGRYQIAEERLLESLRIARQCGATNQWLDALQLLGETAWYRGDVDLSERRWNELQTRAREAANPTLVNAARSRLSYSACARGEYERAEGLCQRALSDSEKGDYLMRGVITLALARAAFFRRDYPRSIEHFCTCLTLLKRTPDAIDMMRALEGLSWLLSAAERCDEATRFLGFLSTERKRRGMILPPVDQPHHERALRLAREALGEKGFAAAWESGGALTLEEAVDFALTMSP